MKAMRIRAAEGGVASAARMRMNNTTIRLLLAVLLLGASACLLSACGTGLKVGEVGAVKEANELAIT